MNRESLENISRLHSLEAENKHLKGLLNRVVPPKNETDVGSSSLLISELETLLSSNLDYNNAIYPVLKEFGELVGVDRVSVFSYETNDECFYATQQWVNQNIQEYHPSDLSIKEFENPLNTPSYSNCFASSNIQKDLQQSLSEKFETFQVQSILIIPFKCAEFSNGLFMLESCHFNREWYDFEIKEIENAVRFASIYLNTLWHKGISDQALYLCALRNQINRKLKGGKKTKKAINEALQIIGHDLAFKSIYIIDKESFSNSHEVAWASSLEYEEGNLTRADLDKLNLSADDDSCCFFRYNSLLKREIGWLESDTFFVISNVIYQKEIKGWLVGEMGSNHKFSETTIKQFWESLAFIIAEVLGSINLENQLNSQRHKLQVANKALSVKESFLDNILNYSPFGIIIVKNRIVNYANNHITTVLGYTQNEVIGKVTSGFIKSSEGDFEEKISHLYKNIDIQGEATEEITIINKAGEEKRIVFYGSRDINGDADSYLIFILDITESCFVKKEIQESRERYHKLLESTVDGVVILNNKGSIHFVNNSFCQLLGYSYNEAMLLKYNEFICEEYVVLFEDVIKQVDLGNDFSGDFVLFKNDRSLFEAELCGALIQLEGVNHYYFSIHDISRRKLNEKILLAREVEARSLAENSPDIILRLNKAGQILFFNQALINQFRFLKGIDILGMSLEDLEILDSLVGGAWQAKVNEVFVSGQKLSMELGFSDESEELYYDWKLSPEINEDGKVETILAIGRNLTLRKTAEKNLVLAKEKAEESDRLKSAFLANISHELRTPLNAIVGFSALLRGDAISPEEKDEYVDVIHKNSDSLMNLINNIIDVAKIESGKISVVKETVAIDTMMAALYDNFLPKVEIEHKGRVKLYYCKPKETGLKISTDPIRLKQVLVNLIGNAIKFTLKGFVEFGYSLDKDEVRFFVKDTGIGISQDKQRLIFQPFRKEDESNHQIFGGTGIGLPISEKLVSALGGRIGLISEKDQGSEFFFTHPMGIKQAANEKPEFLQRTYKISHPLLPKTYQWYNKLVLLVDENSGAHLQMRKYIEKTGLTLVSARTAAGASKLLLNRNDIHLVLMDLSFPDSDGYKLVRIIKEQNKNIPVIAHSVKAFNGEKDRLLKSGFDACVPKPTEKDELLMVMDKYLVEADTKK